MPGRAPPWWCHILRYATWVIAAVAFVLLAWLTWRVLRGASRDTAARPRPVRGADPVDARTWAARARAAAAAGDAREAVRCAYHAVLHRLDEDGAWTIAEARTPREYMRLLPAADRRQPAVSFVARLFEGTWYGGAEPAIDRRADRRAPPRRSRMRRPGGSRDLVVVLVAGALMLLVAGATAVIAPPDEGLGVRGSSLSSGAAGGKAGFLLLRRLGYVVQRTFEPMVSLGANPATDVLVLMAPQQRPSNLDVAALTRFVEAGGVVLVAEQSGVAAVPDHVGACGRRRRRPRPSSPPARWRSGRRQSAWIISAGSATRSRPTPPSTPTLAAPPSPRPGSAADA